MSDPQLKSISFQTFSKEILPQVTASSKLLPEEELQKLKSEFKQKENLFKKDNALKEQRIELLEIEIKESKEREYNLRKMNDNLASALSDLSQDPKKYSNNGLKEIQQTLEKNSKDFIENKLKNNELIKVLECEIKKLHDQSLQEQLKKKDQDMEVEKEKSVFEGKLHELESEKMRLETIIKQIQSDQRKSFDNFTQDNQIKLNKHNEIIDKLKETHEKELMQLQENAQDHFNEMKKIYEEEKASLEIRLEKTQSLVKEYMETSQISEDDGLQKENQKLIQTLNDTSKFHSEELKLFKRTKEDLFNKIRELEKENNRMKEEIMSFYKIKDEIKKRDKELERSRFIIKELEKSEKSLKTLLNEYQHNFIIQANETNVSNGTPHMHCEENDDIELTEQDDNSYILREKPMQINKSNINPKKTSFMASQEIEKMALKFLINNNERPKDYHNEKQPKYSTRKHSHDFLAEDLRKTPLQKKTTSKLSPTYEKPKNAQCKTYRNNENLPLPISEFALKSDRLAQISALENANYARSKANPNINNVPFTTMINLAQNQQIYSEEKSNCLSNNIATALLCEICKQSYQPLEFLEHLESCRSQKNLRNMNYENNNINLHNTNHHHHNSYQNLPIYPQVSHFSTTNNNNEQKRTKSFHYQSAQQISHLNQFNSSSGTSSFNSPQMNMQQMNSMMNHTNQRANQMTPIINQANANEFNDPKILNVLDNLNYEKQLIFDKLREVEYKLKHTEDKNCVLNEEKIGLQRHFEGIVSQLNQAQVQLAMSEEEKSENEQNLKQEIKFLITKLLKAKNKLSEEKNSLQSNPNSSINMSGFLNFYQQNKEDSTFGEKNNENENSILNQSIQNIISSSALTVNHNSKSPIIQKFQSKGQILQNKLNNVKKNDNVRSKTPLLLNSKGNRKLEINRNFNEIRTDFVDCLDLNNNNNRFKKKK